MSTQATYHTTSVSARRAGGSPCPHTSRRPGAQGAPSPGHPASRGGGGRDTKEGEHDGQALRGAQINTEWSLLVSSANSRRGGRVVRVRRSPLSTGSYFPAGSSLSAAGTASGFDIDGAEAGGDPRWPADDGDIAVNHDAGSRWGDPPAGPARMLTGRVPFPVLTNRPLDRTTARIIG